MADPLSIAAAAAGFISLAGTVADGLIEVKKIVHSIKNANHELEQLHQSMKIYAELLRDVGSYLVDQQHLPILQHQAQTLRDCYLESVATVNAAQSLVQRLTRQIARHKVYRVKMPFKENEFKEAVAKIEHSKQNLSLAYLLYTSAAQTNDSREIAAKVDGGFKTLYDKTCQLEARLPSQVANEAYLQCVVINTMQEQHDRDTAEYEACLDRANAKQESRIMQGSQLHDETLALHPGICRKSTRRAADFATAASRMKSSTRKIAIEWGSFKLGYEVSQSYEEQVPYGPQPPTTRRRSSGESTLWSVPIPAMFSADQYVLSFNKAAEGWMFKIRTCWVVGEHTELMKACCKGDIAKARDLLPGLAPDDIRVQERNGYTALQKAVKSGNIELVQLLTAYGAGQNLDDGGKAKIVLSACSVKITKLRESCKAVESLMEYQSDVLRSCEIERDEEFEFDVCPETHRREVLAKDLLSRYASWTLQERLQAFLLLHAGIPESHQDPEVLLRRFGLDPNDRYVLSTTIDSEHGMPSFFHLIAKSASFAIFHRLHLRRVSQTASKAIRAGANVHVQEGESRRRMRRFWTTPLAALLLGSIHQSRKALSEDERARQRDSTTLPKLDRALRRWIILLHEHGSLDLEQYGRQELELFKNAQCLAARPPSPEDEQRQRERRRSSGQPGQRAGPGGMFRIWQRWLGSIEGFEYGPDPEDWRFVYRSPRGDWDVEEAHGEFWEGVWPLREDGPAEEAWQALEMPGSWGAWNVSPFGSS